ncbi:hypothetical protein UO65_3657 [Actinokineospora spheciospongiae]|uniref:Uncharacterized protein n=1 Tax=Actinokineospora spheciospongiae TaxID=909613 RepID=W7IXD1_9PSEU|nr:hypothetical protein UO65_3657 [Actinokineospora spheciospongiae]
MWSVKTLPKPGSRTARCRASAGTGSGAGVWVNVVMAASSSGVRVLWGTQSTPHAGSGRSDHQRTGSS